jgi:hypothetical protein
MLPFDRPRFPVDFRWISVTVFLAPRLTRLSSQSVRAHNYLRPHALDESCRPKRRSNRQPQKRDQTRLCNSVCPDRCVTTAGQCRAGVQARCRVINASEQEFVAFRPGDIAVFTRVPVHEESDATFRSTRRRLSCTKCGPVRSSVEPSPSRRCRAAIGGRIDSRVTSARPPG